MVVLKFVDQCLVVFCVGLAVFSHGFPYPTVTMGRKQSYELPVLHVQLLRGRDSQPKASLMNGFLDSSLTNFTRVGLSTIQSSSSDGSVSNSPDSVIQIDVSQINRLILINTHLHVLNCLQCTSENSSSSSTSANTHNARGSKYKYTVKVMDPSKKAKYDVKELHGQTKLTSMSEVKEWLSENLDIEVADVGYISPGHRMKGKKNLSEDDIRDMYAEYSGQA